MSLAFFAMIQELKAEVAALTARVAALEVRGVIFHEPAPKAEPRATLNVGVTGRNVSESRPTLTLSKRA